MLTRFIKLIRDESAIFIVLSGSVLLLSLSVRYVVVPQFATILQKNSELQKYQDFLSSDNGKSILGQELAQKNELLLDKIASITSSPGSSGDLSSTIEILIKKAKAADIRFVKLEPQPEKVLAGHVVSPVIIEMTTTYHSLGMFVASLEELPYLMKLSRIALSSEGDSKLGVKIQVDCFLYTRGSNE